MSDLIKLLGESPYETLTKTVNDHAATLNQHASTINQQARIINHQHEMIIGLGGWHLALSLAVVALLIGLWIVSRRTRKLSRRLVELESKS